MGMREILFRGKSELFGWIEGWYCPEVKWGDHHFGVGISHKTEQGWLEDTEVVSETVGQYTGLTDKNGKKIFEGDIVRNGDYTMIVVWYDFHAAFMLAFRVDGDYFEAMSNSHIYLEVIGNIHDNPELLRGKDDG